MASKINADEFVDREGEGKPTLPKGVVLSGVTTITTAVVAENEIANSTGINAGIITSTHFAGNLTGDVNAGIVTVTSQSVIGSAVTISASGIDIGAGVITATSYAGSGANLTGIGATIMIWEYNPDPGDSDASLSSTGIGITFNQKIKAGSGNITIRTGGYDGTVVENFGIGSSVTITANSLSLTPTSSLANNAYYYVTLPSGVITNMAGESYVGTAYSFRVPYAGHELWMWGYNVDGALAQNDVVARSSPVQVGSDTTWSKNISINLPNSALATKNDGTLWGWGENAEGRLGLNNEVKYSSPVQVPGTTWDKVEVGHSSGWATKSDGTLWGWGRNENGQLGQNQGGSPAHYSSPVQVGSDTTWDGLFAGRDTFYSVKTDNTLWTMGYNNYGQVGLNNLTEYSSPVQVPGTTWSGGDNKWGGTAYSIVTVKTDGTLWSWGYNSNGSLGQNNRTHYSSPVQIPGTTWKYAAGGQASYSMAATKTDGTLWTWGGNGYGTLGVNDKTSRSSPVQVPGTTWDKIRGGAQTFIATKTDGTLWSWGYANQGNLGNNVEGASGSRSSPIQIPGTWDYPLAARFGYFAGALKEP